MWSYDFMEAPHDGRKFRMLNVVDEFSRECLAIRVALKLKAIDVIDVLSELFVLRGVPEHIRSSNGPEFIAKSVQARIAGVGSKSVYIAPGSPWESGYVESFNVWLRDELLNGEIFCMLREAFIVIEIGRRHYNGVRLMPCSAIDCQHRRCSGLPSPLGRLRSLSRLRRPRYPWCKGLCCTNFELGLPRGG